jgi:hypothetical protein
MNIKFDLKARVFSEIVQNYNNMWSETSANCQKCYTITVFLRLHLVELYSFKFCVVLCGRMVCRTRYVLLSAC